MDKHKKTTVHALSLPYPEPQWPLVTKENEQAILQFLLPLLEPVGTFRHDHVPRSKGKGKGRATDTKKKSEGDSLPTWMPDVYDHLTIGFNSTVRRLETLASSRKPQILAQDTDTTPENDPPAHLPVVFVCRNNLPDIMTSSFPLLMATSAPSPTQARLVEMSAQAEEKISQALCQPRVGVLGIEEGAVGAASLLHFVKDNIEALDIPWLDRESSPPIYHPVKIHTTVSTPKIKPPSRGRKRKKSEG